MTSPAARFAPFLLMLFTGTLANSATVPFMGYFLVSGLDQPPWMLSVYSGLAVVLTVAANRQFGRRIDAGARVFPLIGLAAGGFTLASIAMAASPTLGISYVQSFAEFRPAHATAIDWNTLLVSGLLARPAAGLIAQASDFRTVIQSASLVAGVAVAVLLLGIVHARRAAAS